MTDRGRHHSKAWKARRNFYKKNNWNRETESDPPGHVELPKNYGLKVRLYNRQYGKCAYCNVPFANVSEATIDHLIPVSRGGTGHYHNLRLACRPCNAAKSNLLPEDPEWSKPGTPSVSSQRPRH